MFKHFIEQKDQRVQGLVLSADGDIARDCKILEEISHLCSPQTL
ncbi:hypothetical protein ECTPHS_14166, partial [Ectothiorhodospira sp. PHS-1]